MCVPETFLSSPMFVFANDVTSRKAWGLRFWEFSWDISCPRKWIWGHSRRKESGDTSVAYHLVGDCFVCLFAIVLIIDGELGIKQSWSALAALKLQFKCQDTSQTYFSISQTSSLYINGKMFTTNANAFVVLTNNRSIFFYTNCYSNSKRDLFVCFKA